MDAGMNHQKKIFDNKKWKLVSTHPQFKISSCRRENFQEKSEEPMEPLSILNHVEFGNCVTLG